MNQPPSALLRGRVAIRPWRVGLLVDVDDETQVRDAIAALSSVWGGIYMPILDSRAPTSVLRRIAEVFDLDSLYAAEADGELQELLREPGYIWQGRGPYGPFSPSERGLRKGLLLADALVPTEQVAPWSGPRSNGLLLDAYLGVADPANSHPRPITATQRLLRLRISYADPNPRGLYVVRAGSPRDVARFWTCRALSGEVYPLASEGTDFNSAILRELEEFGLPEPPRPEDVPRAPPELSVWGLSDLGAAERDALQDWSTRLGVPVVGLEKDSAFEIAWFPGVERVASSLFRVRTESTTHSIHVQVPSLPLKTDDIYQGIVAAEINFHQASGLDPRLSAAIPRYRRHSKLLEYACALGADHVRISASGPVLGIQTHADEVGVPLAGNLRIMELLFDEPGLTVSQSHEGQFQTRAAEMFGGIESGVLAQPGLRAAIQLVAGKTSGATLHEIRSVIIRERGGWPHPIFESELAPSDYGQREGNRLLSSGLLVPTLDVECANCRVVNRVTPNDLGVNTQCEFCGEETKLALSLGLRKSIWRFRLAAHVAAEKIHAFLPAMAATAVLAGLHHVEGPPQSHVFGLEVTRPGAKPIEVDIATILHEDRWTVVLGEVKNYHPIDRNDVDNLFSLQRVLMKKEVPCVVLFATLKDRFSLDEQEVFRSAIEHGKRVVALPYRALPLMPLLLTRQDMSLNNFDDKHPWHWATPGQGIFGTAVESCKRNLGLASVGFDTEPPYAPKYTWTDT